MRSTFRRLILATSILGLASACTPTIDVRGNVPAPERLAEVKAGKVTRSDVQALLGTPSSTSTFGDENWYYISSKVQTYAFYKPEELERQVVAISFDQRGVVKDVQTLTLKDGKVVSMESRETPTAGRDMSILEQLVGNVGKFNKGGDKGK